MTFPDGTHAIKNFTLSVEDGEFVVLVGPSGCGKSTLLRILAGLETPTSGDITINGQRVNEQTPQQRNIAMVFQSYALYPHMNVRENLEFPLRMQKLDKDERRQRVQRTAALLNLGDLLDQKPDQLSGGQKQRVAMGRAIVRNPAVFLMDEPLSNLDVKLRVQIRKEIASLQRNLRTTTIYVTHDQTEAMTLGNRVAILQNGELQQVASPDEIYAKPTNLFVANFFGYPAMNLLPAQLEKQDSGKSKIRIGSQEFILGKENMNELPEGPIVIGIRPEELSLFDVGRQLSLSMYVTSIESFGYEKLLYGHLPIINLQQQFSLSKRYSEQDLLEDHFIARLPAKHAIEEGEEVKLYFHADQLHFFDIYGNRMM